MQERACADCGDWSHDGLPPQSAAMTDGISMGAALMLHQAQSHADVEHIGKETITVYRVCECSCCKEIEGMQPGEVVLVNLMLMRPCTRRSGFAYRLPEQPLACTMELQIGTPESFKTMKKGIDAHDRNLLIERFPLLGKLQELANGSEGKLTMPAVGKGGVKKGGDPQQGQHMMDLFTAVDLMHPEPPESCLKVLEGAAPVEEGFQHHEQGRSMPGSRWFRVWQSPGPIFRLESVTFRMAGKAPPLGKFAFVLSGTRPDGVVTHLFEELLTKLPAVKGELQLVMDGQTHNGFLLGNLSAFTKVSLEYFEHERGFQWVDLSDITIKAIVETAKWNPEENTAADADAPQTAFAVPDDGAPQD
jgi:hypothetical protein